MISVLSFVMYFIAGVLIGFIAPSAFGSEGWKFWCGILACVLVLFAKKLAA